jgi:hypothetical protein
MIMVLLSFLTNCKSMQYGHIKKTGNNTYALETAVITNFFIGASGKYYLMNCTAEASGSLSCVEGENGGSGNIGYGAVKK